MDEKSGSRRTHLVLSACYIYKYIDFGLCSLAMTEDQVSKERAIETDGFQICRKACVCVCKCTRCVCLTNAAEEFGSQLCCDRGYILMKENRSAMMNYSEKDETEEQSMNNCLLFSHYSPSCSRFVILYILYVQATSLSHLYISLRSITRGISHSRADWISLGKGSERSIYIQGDKKEGDKLQYGVTQFREMRN